MIISNYISLTAAQLSVNGIPKMIAESEDLKSFLKNIYASRIGGYPKFHKADLLSKAALILTNELLQVTESLSEQTDKVAIIFANNSSSETKDIAFDASIKSSNPSPSLFVYTLPNTCVGEVTIKHKWTGASIFCVANQPSFSMYQENIINMQADATYTHYICGWINETKEALESFVFLVEKESEKELTLPFTEGALTKIILNK